MHFAKSKDSIFPLQCSRLNKFFTKERILPFPVKSKQVHFESGFTNIFAVFKEILYLCRTKLCTSMQTTSVSDFRANIKRYLDAVIQNADSVVINRGNTGAILISLDEYNSIRSTEAILASEKTLAALNQGLKDFEKGDFVEVDINSL